MIHRQTIDPGKLLASYKRSARRPWQRAGLVVLAAMALVFVGLGVAASLQAVQTYGPAAAFSSSKAWYLAAGIGLIFLFGAWIVSGPGRTGILVYERALILPGEKTRSIPWAAITGVIFREMRYRLGWISYDARLILEDGQTVDLSAWLSGKRLVDLVIHIKARTYRHLDEQLRKQIQEGNWVTFSGLALSNKGIQIKGTFHLWQDVNGIRIENGVMGISLADGRLISIGVEKIPNPELLMRVAKDYEGKDEV